MIDGQCSLLKEPLSGWTFSAAPSGHPMPCACPHWGPDRVPQRFSPSASLSPSILWPLLGGASLDFVSCALTSWLGRRQTLIPFHCTQMKFRS